MRWPAAVPQSTVGRVNVGGRERDKEGMREGGREDSLRKEEWREPIL